MAAARYVPALLLLAGGLLGAALPNVPAGAITVIIIVTACLLSPVAAEVRVVVSSSVISMHLTRHCMCSTKFSHDPCLLAHQLLSNICTKYKVSQWFDNYKVSQWLDKYSSIAFCDTWGVDAEGFTHHPMCPLPRLGHGPDLCKASAKPNLTSRHEKQLHA